MLPKIQTALDQSRHWAEERAKEAKAVEDRDNRLKALDSIRDKQTKALEETNTEIDALCEEHNQLMDVHAAQTIRLAG